MLQRKEKTVVVLKSTLRRLPVYYNFLTQKVMAEEEYVSAAKLAEALSLSHVLVRKDLGSISSQAGKPKLGFKTKVLIRDIETYLGISNYDEAVLVGVGCLGHAIMSYNHFNDYGINIAVAFDADKNLDGVEINNKLVLPMSKFSEMIRRLKIRIGIITVPKDSAQEVCDQMVAAGIKAIWNFAPTFIEVPDDVVVRNEDLASSLAALIFDFKSQKLV